MNPYHLEIFDVCVVYTINGELSEECHMVAANEKEDVITAIKWFYRESTVVAIIFN